VDVSPATGGGSGSFDPGSDGGGAGGGGVTTTGGEIGSGAGVGVGLSFGVAAGGAVCSVALVAGCVLVVGAGADDGGCEEPVEVEPPAVDGGSGCDRGGEEPPPVDVGTVRVRGRSGSFTGAAATEPDEAAGVRTVRGATARRRPGWADAGLGLVAVPGTWAKVARAGGGWAACGSSTPGSACAIAAVLSIAPTARR
jgi:hypothetical protein